MASLPRIAGGIAFAGHIGLAVAFGVAIMSLLAFKGELHRFVQHISRDDIIATVKFAIITAIVLGMVVYDFWDQCVRKKPE